MNANFLFGQEKTDYSTFLLENLDATLSVSSTYWMGGTYAFFIAFSPQGGVLAVNKYYISESGVVAYVNEELFHNLSTNSLQVTSCVYKKDLYCFLFIGFIEEYEIMYFVKSLDHDFEPHSISINEHITQQMAAVSFNDTIYMFFVDEADKLVKYYEIVYSDAHSKLVLVNETPTILNNEYTSVGNVAAITYVNDSLTEQIMVAFPGAIEGKSNNKINLFSGNPGQFELIGQKPSVHNFHIFELSMIQGSVKGASTGSYNIQFGYNIAFDANKGPARCEFSLKTNEFSDWELLDFPGNDLLANYTWFMEFYTKPTHTRKKYIVHGYNNAAYNYGILWESDILQYADKTEEVAPISHAKDLFDLVLVAEGAPPYALNGYKLSDPAFDVVPPSTFDYVVSNENSISTLTTYSLSVEANMGLGPVTAGFKDSFMESSGTTVTETTTITQQIIPPKIDSDSAGLMWYYYVAPTVERERWIMRDWEGNDIEPKRNLFFFKLNSPQMLNFSYKLDYFGTNSPRAYDLESYKLREVQNIAGIEVIKHISGVVDFAGSSTTINVDFSESHTIKHDEKFEVSVGVDADYGIFSASASITTSLEYERERTTTCEKGFKIDWALFAAKNPEDENNVRRFTPAVFITKTTDSTAYFLLEEFKQYKPFFITYEVDSITYGNFLDPPYFIGETPELISKYNFSNYPNPFSYQSKFEYTLPHRSNVSLSIYNTYGQLVNMPVNEIQSTGNHQIELKPNILPAGIYYYRLLIDEDLIMGKIIKN